MRRTEDDQIQHTQGSENTIISLTDKVTAPCTSKGKKLKSVVWQCMSREERDDGSIKATCNFCKKPFTANSAGGTSHLKRHIDSCPARINRSVKNFCIRAPLPESGSNMMLRNPNANFEEVRRALCLFVISGSHPFSIIEEPGFKYLMSVICPNFHQISRKTLKRDALAQYKEEKKLVAMDLQNAPGRICFTSDNWRSEHTSDEYMCITAHWVDHNWCLQKRIIKFSALSPPFDGASLADEILLSMGHWKIADKVFCFSVDNASYNDTMIASLRNHIGRKHTLVHSGDFFHMRCSCHIINLVVQAGLKLIDDVVLKIRSIVKHLRHSIPKQKKFYEIAQSSFGLSTTKKLRMDTVIRWNSTFTMLDRFLYFRDAVDSFVYKDMDMRVHRLSVEEWDKVDELYKFLKVFYDVTNLFSASKTPTANIYFHGVWRIHKKLIDVANSPHSILSGMVNEMQVKFDKYWSDYNLILSCAAVLDPRYKLERVEYCYERLYGEVYAKEMVILIKNTLFELFEKYRGVVTSPRVGTSKASEGGDWSPVLGGDADVDDDYELYDAFWSKKMKSNDKSELELYLEERNASIKKELDILSFWKDNACRYPSLASLARDLLCIPISTVPSESAFSLGKKMITPYRSSLASQTIEAIACYEDWLRAKGLLKGESKFFNYGMESLIEEEGEESDEVEAISQAITIS